MSVDSASANSAADEKPGPMPAGARSLVDFEAVMRSAKYPLLGTLAPSGFVAIWWDVVAAGVFPRSVLPSPFAVAS